MNRSRSTQVLVTVVASALLLAGCGPSTSAEPSGAGSANTQVSVTITNAGCPADPASAPAGDVEFEITNQDGDQVSEVELLHDGEVLAEKENLAVGLSGSFTIELEPGDYVLECPGADEDETPFEVTAAE